MTTPADARKKWCPFAASRVAMFCKKDGQGLQSVTIANQPHTDADPVMTCVTYDCMAWRWDTDFNKLIDKYPGADLVEMREHQADGHCGLAGNT